MEASLVSQVNSERQGTFLALSCPECTSVQSVLFYSIFLCLLFSLQLRHVLQPHPGPSQAAQEEAASDQPGLAGPSDQAGQDELQPGSLQQRSETS